MAASEEVLLLSPNNSMATSIKILQLLDKTSVRDRLCRLVQYSIKLMTWLLEQQESETYSQILLKAKGLETSISLARKLFRIGKGFDHLRMAFETIHLRDPMQRVLITLGKLSRFLFLLFDHLVWAGRLRLLGINAKRWSIHSTRFWFLAITFGLLRDVYDIFRALKIEYSRLRHNSTGAKRNMSTLVTRTVYNNPALMLDIVKNSTDIFLPISSFERGRGISLGWVGLMGVVSSICGLISAWDKGLKLQYS